MTECKSGKHDFRIEHVKVRDYPEANPEATLWIACKDCGAYFEGYPTLERTN